MEVTVEKLVPGGDGMARLDGKVVFIPDCLPGERLKIRLLESRKDFARGKIVEILEAAPGRREPPCALSGRCGGCDWQHIDYAEQLRQKVALTRDALRRTGGFDWPELEIIGGKPLAYRNRIQLHRDAQGRMGFHARGSRNLIPVDACPVAHPAFTPLFSGAVSFGEMGSNRARPTHPADEGDLRLAAWAHTPARKDETGSPSDILITGAEGARAPGFMVDVLGRPIHFDLRCFFQSNLDMLEKLLPFALAGPGGELALDLYCGVGLFGAFLREKFTRVLAVEENPVSLDYARRNIGPEHLFFQGRLEELLAQGGNAWPDRVPDLALVDPPRPGLDPEVRKYLIAKRPERVVYVSCHPVTLARDLKDLLAGGFQLRELKLFDFYPQTAHVEVVAKLSR